MSVEIADVADALVAFLAGQTFSAPYETISPERLYDPAFAPDQLARLKVSVVGVDWSGDLADSDEAEEEIVLAVCVQKSTDRSRREMDELCRLVREVAHACLTAQLDAVGASATKAVFDPLYDVSRLRDDGVFWSGLLVTFQVMEGLA